jgi:hypothetical protein
MVSAMMPFFLKTPKKDVLRNILMFAVFIFLLVTCRLYDRLGYVSLGVAGAGAITSLSTFLSIPSLDDLNNEYEVLGKEIRFLEGVLQ